MVRTGTGLGTMRVRGTEFSWGTRTYVMAIVNVTPDSFSGDGRAHSGEAAAYATSQAAAGADLLDIGGESTRPGYHMVPETTEIERVVPVIETTRAGLPHVPISIDTYKPAVVRAAHAAGADLVNSVWGAPPFLAELAAELAMPIVIMHNQVGTEYERPVVDTVLAYLERAAARAVARGIAPERVILDPGIGFGKTAEHNLEILAALSRLVALGFPTMIGTSRKSTLGKLTGREPHERVSGTVATTALAVAAGIDVVRVHDVGAARDAVAVSDAIVRGWRPAEWIE